MRHECLKIRILALPLSPAPFLVMMVERDSSNESTHGCCCKNEKKSQGEERRLGSQGKEKKEANGDKQPTHSESHSCCHCDSEELASVAAWLGIRLS
jgi:hypothetical protein